MITVAGILRQLRRCVAGVGIAAAAAGAAPAGAGSSSAIVTVWASVIASCRIDAARIIAAPPGASICLAPGGLVPNPTVTVTPAPDANLKTLTVQF